MEFFDEPPGYFSFNDANSNVNQQLSPQLYVQNSPQVAVWAQNQRTVGATDGPAPENASFYFTEAQEIPLGHHGSESHSSLILCPVNVRACTRCVPMISGKAQ
jgi:hypothetical protein